MPGILCYYYQLLYKQAERVHEVAKMYSDVAERFKKKRVL
jgi:hypothetical protein